MRLLNFQYWNDVRMCTKQQLIKIRNKGNSLMMNFWWERSFSWSEARQGAGDIVTRLMKDLRPLNELEPLPCFTSYLWAVPLQQGWSAGTLFSDLSLSGVSQQGRELQHADRVWASAPLSGLSLLALLLSPASAPFSWAPLMLSLQGRLFFSWNWNT